MQATRVIGSWAKLVSATLVAHDVTMKSQAKHREPVLAAGGIVLRADAGPCVAVVRLRKNNAWVLPKGKLKPGEDVREAAKREATEETGHDVAVHEYLGEIPSEPGRRKAVRFWRMQAAAEPSHKLMDDVKSVKWLPLDAAVAKLTHPHERAFLRRVGPAALQAAGFAEPPTLAGRIRTWLRGLGRGWTASSRP
jgi:8-oxo-dGTP diphosphatase